MTVHITTKQVGRPAGIDRRSVRRLAERMLAALDRAEADLSILLCSDEVIAELNQTWRGKAGPTDVLSFPMEAGGDDEAPRPVEGLPELLGDIVISVPTARRQATGPLREEVARLLGHGLLHLTGWTHDTEASLRAMEQETDRLIDLSLKRG